MVDLTRPYRVGGLLLDCVCAKLSLTEAGCPARRCLVPGVEPSVENCCAGKNGGQLTVHIVRSYPSRKFPLPDVAAGNCDAPLDVVTYSVQVWRCMPTGTVDHPPRCDDIDDTALTAWTDKEAIRLGVACCLRDRDTAEKTVGVGYDWIFGDFVTKGPEGGCVGSEQLVQIGLPVCWEC